ncbi:MAG: RNA polymerase subunit sigma-70, partial [Planctomycetales bacterium]|nr:RNA polymerase subunit sigma-70 [Planctomycetales bacterium]
MTQHDVTLRDLIDLAKRNGRLSYQQVFPYLPDETEGVEKIESLLGALDRLGIELYDECPPPMLPEERPTANAAEGDRSHLLAEMAATGNSDPIRMYLSQMAEIPLLAREEEIALAKKIELTRKRFRRNLLRSFYALEATVKTLERVHAGELPFDRTIKVSLTERLTKEQVSARMPGNLATLRGLMDAQRRDFAAMVDRRVPAEEKATARRRYLNRREKMLVLVEELSLRSRRVTPLISELEEYAQRMEEVIAQLRELKATGAPTDKIHSVRAELLQLMR